MKQVTPRDPLTVFPRDHCAMMDLPEGFDLHTLSMLLGPCHLQNAVLATVAADNGPSWSSSKPTTVDR
jgi:hypothetical protein